MTSRRSRSRARGGSPFTGVALALGLYEPRILTALFLTKCVCTTRDVIRATFCRYLAWSTQPERRQKENGGELRPGIRG